MNYALMAAEWVALGFLAGLGALILFKISTGAIDISRLISEPTGDASMSRFQLLIFTFVIAAAFLMVVAAKGDLVDVPQGVYLLLGISGTSYAVSKSIQFSRDEGVEERPPSVHITNGNLRVPAGSAPIHFQAKVLRAPTQRVTWSLEGTPLGAINKQTGEYTPPAGGHGEDKVRATSVDNQDTSDTATVTIV